MSDELQDWLRTASFRMKRDLVTVVREQAANLADAIKAEAPVKTGRLRDSIKVRRTRNDLTLYVTAGGNDTSQTIGGRVEYDYSLALEFGTRRMSAHPFFYPVARRMEDEIRDAIEQAVDKAINR